MSHFTAFAWGQHLRGADIASQLQAVAVAVEKIDPLEDRMMGGADHFDALPRMQISRVVARLEQGGLITRATDPDDRRNLVVRLTAAGRALYRKIEPIVLEREAFLLDALDSKERAALTDALARIEERARHLQQAT